MKYSWQKMQAPFLLPSIVDALIIRLIHTSSCCARQVQKRDKTRKPKFAKRRPKFSRKKNLTYQWIWKNSTSACFLPFLCCASASSLVDYFAVLQQTSLDDYFAADHHSYHEPTLMINSISGTLNPFSASAILRLRHLPRFSETELEHSLWCLFFGFRFGMHCGPDYTLSPMCSKKGSWGFLSPHRKNLTLVKNLLKLRHESGDLNSSSHYHVKLIWCLLTLVGSTLRLLWHTWI